MRATHTPSASFSCEAACSQTQSIFPVREAAALARHGREVTDRCVGILYSGFIRWSGGIRRHGSSAQSSWSHTSVALLYGPWVLFTNSSSPVSTRFCRSGKTVHFYTHTHKNECCTRRIKRLCASNLETIIIRPCEYTRANIES